MNTVIKLSSQSNFCVVVSQCGPSPSLARTFSLRTEISGTAMIPFIWQYVADETWVRTILGDPGAVSRVGRKARRKFPSRLFSRWVRTGMTSTALGIVREACNFWYSTKLCRNTYIPRLVISWYIVKLNSLIPIVSIKWDFQFRDPPWSTFSCFRFNTRLLNTGTLTQVFKFKCELLSSLHYINAGRNLEFIYTGIFFSFFFLLWDGKRLRHLHATRCS